jgi:oxygen-independent coproporphyrinogen-3 oxidase
LRGEEVAGLVGEAAAIFGILEPAEVTVEVNPATWSYNDFARARAGGVNRFSIGVQSTQDEVLRLLGRAHDGDAAKRAVREVLRCGASSVSVDLLYGLPGEGGGSWRRSLMEMLDMEVHHISLYALTLADRTPMSRMVARGEVALPGDDEVADEYMEASTVMEEAGYRRYEISNFSLPGYQCRHNLAYWRREEYLGIGAGAHSLLQRCRFNNTPSLLAYLRMIREGELALEKHHTLERSEELEEEIMLGLRTSQGIAEGLLEKAHDRMIDLRRGGLLEAEGGRVNLTARGMLVSNAVITELLIGDDAETDALDGRSRLRQSKYSVAL